MTDVASLVFRMWRGGTSCAAGLALTGLLTGCDWHLSDPRSTDPRLLDRACLNGGCLVEGTAVQTTGITGDSIGFKIGPGAGTVRIPLKEFTSVEMSSGEVASVSALVAGKGGYSMLLGVPGESLSGANAVATNDYQWMKLPGKAPSDGGTAGTAELVFQVYDGSSLEIADIQAVGYDEVGACTMRGRERGGWGGIVWVVVVMVGWMGRNRARFNRNG